MSLMRVATIALFSLIGVLWGLYLWIVFAQLSGTATIR